jgi:1,6-anhydro-N-acetylmuramate kinase
VSCAGAACSQRSPLGAVLTGCGGGDDSAGLVERARLGLPGATDPTRPPGDAGGEAEARLFAYAGGAFPTSRASTAPSCRPSTRAE